MRKNLDSNQLISEASKSVKSNVGIRKAIIKRRKLFKFYFALASAIVIVLIAMYFAKDNDFISFSLLIVFGIAMKVLENYVKNI